MHQQSQSGPSDRNITSHLFATMLATAQAAMSMEYGPFLWGSFVAPWPGVAPMRQLRLLGPDQDHLLQATSKS